MSIYEDLDDYNQDVAQFYSQEECALFLRHDTIKKILSKNHHNATIGKDDVRESVKDMLKTEYVLGALTNLSRHCPKQ